MESIDDFAQLVDGAPHPFDLPPIVPAMSAHGVDVRDVRRVMVGDTGDCWWEVSDSSFQLDSRSFIFRYADMVICGPSSSVRAVIANASSPSVKAPQWISQAP
jgi:hypothetical protein